MSYLKLKEVLSEISNFETVKELPVKSIVTSHDLRKCCDANMCGKFGACWTCPPAIAPFEECVSKISEYDMGVLIHQSYELEDEYDYEGMFDAAKEFDLAFRTAYYKLREMKEFEGMYALSAGGCNICEKCTYPDEPCRFPDKILSSLESHGIYVLDLAKKCDVKYRKSPKHIDYYGMFFVK